MLEWTRWEPIQELSKKYDLREISDDIESLNLKIVLFDIYNETNKVQITFSGSIYAYRNIYESFWVKNLYDLDLQYGSDFYSKWTFFKVANSEYLTLLSQNLVRPEPGLLIQFSFIAANFIIDIVADHEPIVEFIK